MAQLTTICANVCEAFLATVIAFLIIVGLSIVVIIATPTAFLYRYCLTLSFKWFRPDFDKILSSGNTFMAAIDDIYGINTNTTVVALRIKGIPEIDEVRKITTEKMIEAKSKEGELKYPELKQFPYRWMGYYFWKYEDFDIKTHVNYYTIPIPEQERIYSEDDVAVIEAELMTKPHTKDTSPWEIIVVPNVKSKLYNEPSSIVFFRTHHGLMDGFAILQLLIGELGGEDLKKLGIVFPNPVQRNLFQKFLYYGSLVFRLPYDLAYSAVKRMGHLQNEFRQEHDDLSLYFTGTVPIQIQINTLKEIRYAHKVGLTSVIAAILIGALRRSMLDNNMKIPKNVIFGSPQPLPDHPGKLRVHASAACLILPIGIQDSIKRLKAIDDFMSYIKRSTETEALAIFGPLAGSLPLAVIDYFMPTDPVTGVLNIFPGPSRAFKIYGYEVNSMHFSYGQQKTRQPLLFSALSYAENVNMKININKSRFSDLADVKKISSYVLEELETLQMQQV